MPQPSGQPRVMGDESVRVLWFLLSGVCHQFIARSLQVGGQALPLCARCSGTFPVIILSMLSMRIAGVGRRSELPRGWLAVICALLGLAWTVDGANSVAELLWGTGPLYAPSNALRLLTGAGLGVAVGLVLYPIYHQLTGRGSDPRPMPGWALAPAALAAAGLAALLWWAPGGLHAVLSWGLGLSVVGALALVNGLLARAILNRSRRPVALWVVGLALGLAEMSAIALARLWLVGPNLALPAARAAGII